MMEAASVFNEGLIRKTLFPYVGELTPDIVEKIRRYADLLARWNRTISLTSLRNPEEILRIHFGESLFGAQFLDFGLRRLADIGSGAGFPGLALKIVRPNLELVLIESNTRKAAFLSEAVRVLGFHGVEVFRGRMEAFDPRDFRFDYVIARAVGNFSELLEWSSGQIAPGGRVILWVGPDAVEELRKVPGWDWKEPVLIPQSHQRFIVEGNRVFADENVSRETFRAKS